MYPPPSVPQRRKPGSRPGSFLARGGSARGGRWVGMAPSGELMAKYDAELALAVADRISLDKSATLAASLRDEFSELAGLAERQEMERVAARAAAAMAGSIAARGEGALMRMGEFKRALALPPRQLLAEHEVRARAQL